MKPVLLEALAVDDLRDAVAWYEVRALGLGQRFAGHVDGLIEQIGELPLAFAVVHRDLRRALVRPFPYGVFFRDEEAVVKVVAIFHLHRDPATWKMRP